MSIDWDKYVAAPLEGVFGEGVTYYPKLGGSFDISGIFDEAYQEVTLTELGSPNTVEIPVLGVRLASFNVMPVQNDKLLIKRTGQHFIVKEVRTDGHAMAKLMLNETVYP